MHDYASRQEKSKESSEHTIGKALLDIVGQKYGEGDEAGEITMENVKLTCWDLIGAGVLVIATCINNYLVF